jgi:hypothetical protein
MPSYEVTLTSKAQITIPAELRQKLRLEEGRQDRVPLGSLRRRIDTSPQFEPDRRLRERSRTCPPGSCHQYDRRRGGHRRRTRKGSAQPASSPRMIGLDSNIILRAITGDDPVQSPLAGSRRNSQMEAAVTRPDAKDRGRTFAALRGILNDNVGVPPPNEELDLWIDAARSQAFDRGLAKRTGRNTEIAGNKDGKQD